MSANKETLFECHPGCTRVIDPSERMSRLNLQRWRTRSCAKCARSTCDLWQYDRTGWKLFEFYETGNKMIVVADVTLESMGKFQHST